MEKSRIELKVGLFAAVAILLLCILLILFSKSTSLFRGTEDLYMTASNVGGLKERAAVLMAGVQIGSVYTIKLTDHGRSVRIDLKVYSEYEIHKDARFVIEQSGFLGDQYVSVIPTTLNEGPILTNYSEVVCEEPFNMQKVARSASGFLKHIDATAQKVDAAVTDLRATVLNENTLTNFSIALVNLRKASQNAVGTVDSINGVIATNSAEIAVAVSNLVYFSSELTNLAANAETILTTNGDEITASTKNIENTTEKVNSILSDIQSGKGLAGTVLENQQLSTNVQGIINNIAVASSNLNRLGLWGFLWHHEPLRTNSVSAATPAK
jgi:phospholipid/cholesterol/gamma-HCH transport system substrate-binding protein